MDDQTVALGNVSPDMAPLLGLWGPFRLLEKVGQGSFGEVYRALDTKLQREVALKLLLRSDAIEAEESVLREARSLARVRHPNVVPVYGVDTHNGRVGFWSDFVHGRTLSAIVAENGPFGAREAALIGVDVCQAVGAVHAAGLLHRDIKTGNVMRESGGRILLMDFGLTHDAESAEQSGGTVLYMAPELLQGKPATVATDVYAIGVLLFHLLTGQYPVQGDSISTITATHQAGARKMLLDVRPNLPEPLGRVVNTALQPDPANRYQSTGQLIAGLTEALGLSSTAAASRPSPSRTPWWFAGALGLAAVLGIVAYEMRSRTAAPGSASLTATVQDEYAKAHDLLEHYYRPHALETAIPALENITKANPNFAPAFADLGRANMLQFTQLRDANYLEPARQASLRALSLKPDMASAHVTLGMLYTWTGKNDLAAQELDEALKLDTFNSAAHAARGSLLLRRGRPEEAQASLQRAVDLSPDDWGVVGQLASYFDETGKYDLAAEHYRRAVSLAPDNPRALNNLGLVYRNQGKFEEAEAAYRQSIALEPTAGHYRNLGQTLLEHGRAKEAIEMLERAMALKADSYRAWGFLAAAYAEKGDPPDKVRETYQKAIDLSETLRKTSPDSGYLFADVGGYYAALGQAEQSEQWLRRAVAYSTNAPEVLYEVAIAYERLHRRDQALQYVGRAVAGGISTQFIERNALLSALRTDGRYQTTIDRARHSQ